ncbi:MAG: family 1 encapsulin nanocompartment shell protein [Candidatus Binatia bacterium]
MSADLLRRDLAPIGPEAWEEIDREASRVLKLKLVGRKIVDFDGPHGWKCAAVNLGRLGPLERAPGEGVEARVRLVQPLIEVRVPFSLDREDLDGVARGAKTFELEAVVEAAERAARTEDDSIFKGYAGAGITGIVEASPHKPVAIPSDATKFPDVLLQAAQVLREAGVNGPYALVLGDDWYRKVSLATITGHPIRRWIEQQILDGPLLWAPSIEGALVLSMRGGDFELTVGQDVSVGYSSHDAERVELFLVESFTFRVLDGAAAVALRPGG